MTSALFVLVQAVGWTLIHFIWKGGLLGIATALLLRLLRNSSPQSRYALTCGALFLCVVIPMLDIYRYFATGIAALAEMRVSNTIPSTAQSVALAPMQQFMPWLVACWLLGVVAMTGRVAIGLIWIVRVSSVRRSWENLRWQFYVSQIATRWGMRRKVIVRVADHFSSLLTVGWWRPVVLVPAALLTKMPSDLLEALLAHEVAHIKRLDYLVNLAQRIIEALLFYHPVVWWLSHHIRIEREQIADDLAASFIGEPRRLAIALEQLSQMQFADGQATFLAQCAKGGNLSDRIKRLVRPSSRPLSWKVVLPAIVFTAIVTGMTVHLHQPAPAPSSYTVRETVAAVSNVVAQAAKGDDLKAFSDLIESNHALVLDDLSGKVLLQKNAGNVVPIASLTKLMTAMVVLDAKTDMNRIVGIDQTDADVMAHSLSGVPVGTRLPLHELMQLALMSSDNRAAYALARSYPGGMSAFELAVHAKISALGLTHTTLNEPTGLSPDNTSTAIDVAIMVNAAAQYPEITRDTTYASDIIKINGKPVEYHNTNPFVGKEGWDIQLSKTGFTDEAGRCLIMRIKSAGKNITVVLLNADRTVTSTQDIMNIRHLLMTNSLSTS